MAAIMHQQSWCSHNKNKTKPYTYFGTYCMSNAIGSTNELKMDRSIYLIFVHEPTEDLQTKMFTVVFPSCAVYISIFPQRVRKHNRQ